MNPATTASAQRPLPGLLYDYRPPAGTYDEMFTAAGAPRDHWPPFLQLASALGPQELSRRWTQAQRLIRENGVTYNVHGDPGGQDRRWELDALPLLLPASEWNDLAAGLAQRARLLNAVLVDLYGPQRLLREGVVPAELVFAHPNFLRACHGWPQPNRCHLHLYAAHLARSADGAWWVTADRTQAPVGAGYAVENRIVISRMMPHVFHHCQVQRLAGFFIALRATLSELAARHRENPHTVLLSPGPASPTYFEDSYLARYLGYTLVEGEDLTVRDNRVFLKTLSGLVRVDVVLRRVRDELCDPLELSGHSRQGVPGLVHSARRGHVVLANALGSGLLEAPALMAFLPRACQRLLGEDLRLPSVRTWWCGDPKSLTYVLDNLERMIVRPTIPDPSVKLIQGASLTREQRGELAARIRARPERWVAQDLINRSTAPVWNDGTARSGHIALRTFTVASGDTYQVMPGALAHVSATTETQGESMFVGQGSKDVWIQSEGPVAPLTLLPPPEMPIALRRSGLDLPSRVADNLFWLGRHVERAEGTARLLRSIVTRLLGEASTPGLAELPALFRTLAGNWSASEAAKDSQPKNPNPEAQVLSFLYDQQNVGSLQSMVQVLRRTATVVRDRISLDSWRILQRIDDDFNPGYPLGVVSLADVMAMLNQMVLNFSAFSGTATENMTRGPGWQFLELGRRFERALGMIGLLRGTVTQASGNEQAVLETLLEIADSSMTYRNRYATNLQVAAVLDLLMTDETNPRAVAYQMAAISRQVDRLPQQDAALLSSEQKLVLAVLSTVRLADLNLLAEVEPGGSRERLDALLEQVEEQLCQLASSISHRYLVHAGPARQLAEIDQPRPATPNTSHLT